MLEVETSKNLMSQSNVSLSNEVYSSEFQVRLREHLPTLKKLLGSIYTDVALEPFLSKLISAIHECYLARPESLKLLDKERIKNPLWFQSEKMLGGVCYVDLYAKNLSGIRAQIPYFQSLGLTYLHLMPLFKTPLDHNDGGYAVSSYRDVNTALGSMQDLNDLANELREAGISLVLDFIFNHTADDHAWAKACLAGDEKYRDFYLIYPDRAMPDLFEKNVREIFPEEHSGAFTQLPDGRWVWTTFHSYQWDLNYANPEVFLAMACEMLFIANQGAEILRMDAVAFLWKKLGTVCENLPEVHTLIQAFNTVAKIVAPSLLFKSEAIVHPDDVIRYISNEECQISYNPLQMALLWSTLATRQVNLLNQALTNRHHLPHDCSWVNYVRSHDDIGWTFSDEDAAHFYINGFKHREYLNNFYLGRFPASFAEGVPFQENQKNGDCRICGTTGSLVGLGHEDAFAVDRILVLYSVVMSAGGVPLVYLGDEVGILNNLDYVNDPAKSQDSRWVHRVEKDESLYQMAMDEEGDSLNAQLYRGFKKLIHARKSCPALAGGKLSTIATHNPSVICYLRVHASSHLYVIANFSEKAQKVDFTHTPLHHATMIDVISGELITVASGFTVKPYQFLWLKYTRSDLI